jgi:hypothetical protein
MRQIGRRTLFFGAMVVVSLLLYYPTPPDLRWLCIFTASLAGFWAVAFALEDLTAPPLPRRPVPRSSRQAKPEGQGESAPKPELEPETPFGPPPPPGTAST